MDYNLWIRKCLVIIITQELHPERMQSFEIYSQNIKKYKEGK